MQFILHVFCVSGPAEGLFFSHLEVPPYVDLDVQKLWFGVQHTPPDDFNARSIFIFIFVLRGLRQMRKKKA